MKKLAKNLFAAGMLLMIGIIVIQAKVYAAQDKMTEDSEATNQVMVAQEEIEAREQPSDTAPVIERFTIGTPILVMRAVDETWYEISYQEQTLYVRQSGIEQLAENEELEQEFQQMEEEGAMIISAVEQYRQDRIRSRIWAGVILLLVIGIFAVGIVGSVRNKKGVESDKTNKYKNNTSDLEKEIEMIDLNQE